MAKFDPLAAIELLQLVSEYWYELDANKARNMPGFYHEDCSFRAGDFYSGTGKAAVSKFYRTRSKLVAEEKEGVRTTRHTYSNFKVTFADDGSADVVFVLTNYSGGGNPPITDFTGPSMVTDVALRCRRDDEGQWKIASFHGTPLFMVQEEFAEKFLNSPEGITAA